MNETLEGAALEYLAKGLTVIPIRGRYAKTLGEAKRPLVRWEKWQGKKPNAEVIRGWFAQKPLADLGLLTGPSNGLLALDVDGEKGYQSIADKPIPDTWVNCTRRGKHYLFSWDDRLSTVASTKVGVLPGIDVRGKGGYVVISPSVGIGDFVYTWLPGSSPDDRPLSKPPEWLIQLLLKSEPATEVVLHDSLGELWDGVAAGENRHQALTRLASFYASRGLTEEDITRLMVAWNERCTPPKPEDEFLVELEGVLEYWKSGRYKSNYKPATQFQVTTSTDFLQTGPTEINWLVKDLIPSESIGFLHGYGGLGKSWMALDLAIEIGRGGGAWLGHFFAQGGKVLYVDEESHGTLLRYRYQKLLKGKSLTPNQVDISFLSLSGLKLDQTASIDAFKGLLVELQPTLIIVDAFVSIHSLNENSSQDMGKLRSIFKELITDCKTGLLFIDHDNKPGMVTKTAAQRQRGSGEKDAVADYKIALSRNEDQELFVEHSKARYTNTVPPFKVEIVDTDPGTATKVVYAV